MSMRSARRRSRRVDRLSRSSSCKSLGLVAERHGTAIARVRIVSATRKSPSNGKRATNGKSLGTDVIEIVGAREHNLSIDRLILPKNRLVVFTGPSGSGKSSLAFDTLYAEGQRRYVESLSAYARQFLGRLDRPAVERLRGLSPTISIEQKSASSNPRSTVGTITEIHDYLRVLWARAGRQHCVRCDREVRGR